MSFLTTPLRRRFKLEHLPLVSRLLSIQVVGLAAK
jgi:hypothetical protein